MRKRLYPATLIAMLSALLVVECDNGMQTSGESGARGSRSANGAGRE